MEYELKLLVYENETLFSILEEVKTIQELLGFRMFNMWESNGLVYVELY
jgi:hypothetical protein